MGDTASLAGPCGTCKKLTSFWELMRWEEGGNDQSWAENRVVPFSAMCPLGD